MTDAKQALRDELATGTRILGRHEMIGMFGHISLLTEDPEYYLLCPGAGTRKDRCRAVDVLQMHLDDQFRPGLPLELYMHSEMHRQKPHIKSLIHVHSPALTALSALEHVPSDLLMFHAAFWPEKMPIFEEPELVDNREKAERLISIMGEESVSLLRWHGAVIIGETVREAVFRALLAEQHAQQTLTALSHGKPLSAVPSDIPRPELYRKMLPPFTHDMCWWFESSYVPEPQEGAIVHAHSHSDHLH